MSLKQFAATLGFAFVAAWIAFSFGQAVLCLIGAAIFYGMAGVAVGEIDLARVQDRIQGAQRPTSPTPPAHAAPPRSAPRVR